MEYQIPNDLERVTSSVTTAITWSIPQEKFEKIWNDRRVDGSGIKCAYLDTGFTPHPDLPDPLKMESFIRGESTTDLHGHGTHCAGTILGRGGIGVAPGADLLVGKVLSNAGSGGSDGIVRGVRWAIEQGADIISMSIGGGGYYQPMADAIAEAWRSGVLVVAAAGNSGYRGANTIDYPGKYAGSVCVGSYQQDGTISNFSSGGRQIDCACPGSNITSASHRGSGYAVMSGTSMATPYMAGLFALIIQQQRREGWGQFQNIEAVRDFLQRFSADAGEEGFDNRFGWGVPLADKIVDSLSADDITTMGMAV